MLTNRQLDLIEQGDMDAVADGLSQAAGDITLELVKMARRSIALTELAACMYQAAGAFNMPVRFLDALSAAAQGEAFEHLMDGLLPVSTDEPGAWDPDSAINSQRKEGGEG
ncbi:hypothetical protein CAL14_05345 [Bordetella genomosp. 9]|uniref:hypothetical protein n=1 Tax=Bordetella genomosp. 9 TaxID=1416803 RepID=UPI000A295D91|nr:hypothetical protein [Bordetella genomosp. 9]ARP89780.1 hypothetical protein CAL14_05345 [Bordetella genomosp. 9]